jgi:hypothetical protein
VCVFAPGLSKGGGEAEPARYTLHDVALQRRLHPTCLSERFMFSTGKPRHKRDMKDTPCPTSKMTAWGHARKVDSVQLFVSCTP